MWADWEATYGAFYEQNQRAGIGRLVNDAGYSVMRRVDLSGKVVAEMGAGDIRHHAHWVGQPSRMLCLDVSPDMLARSGQVLDEKRVPHDSILFSRGESIPIPDATVDVMVTFYSLEHLNPLDSYLQEMQRVLRPEGTIVGAIPAEGGLAWGAGRMATSRRWFKRHTSIDPDKIICWEHPNFADRVLERLDLAFTRVHVDWWPFNFAPHPDVNLVCRFVYQKLV